MSKFLPYFLYLLLLVLIFPAIFQSLPIQGGDYYTLNHTQLDYFRQSSFSIIDSKLQLGGNVLPLIHYAPFSLLIGLVGALFQDNSLLVERLVWWFPFFIVGFYSQRKLMKYVLPQIPNVLGPLIYMGNTYVLMILGGGQIAGIGLAYAWFPFVLLQMLILIDTSYKDYQSYLRQSLWTGMILAIFLVIEVRTTYILLLAVFFYWIYFIINKKHTAVQPSITSAAKSVTFVFAIPLLVTGLVHSFWLLPTILLKSSALSQYGDVYTSAGAVQFFSFAKLPQTISLLHPNWPENLFGKTYFMRPEFFISPLIAFASLLFVRKSKDIHEKYKILFFALLALLGAWLAKGSNEPFGDVYVWIFDHVPGFVLFRDATKFYVLVAIAYAILIPYSITQLSAIISKKMFKKYISCLITILFISYALFSIREAVLHRLTGTFISHSSPNEYVLFNKFIAEEPNFYRTLWIPQVQRYVEKSDNHPVVSANDFFHVTNTQSIIKKLQSPGSEKLLHEAAIKYVIVPFDTEGELFLRDRTYDDNQYKLGITALRKLSWLKEVRSFGKIIMFSVSSPISKFQVAGSDSAVPWKMISPVRYQILTENATINGRIVFSEAFDQNWTAISKGKVLHPVLYHNYFNVFVADNWSGTIDIYYEPQRWLEVGLYISLIVVGVWCLVFVILVQKKNYA